MDSWIDVVLRGMTVVVFVCMAVIAAPFIIFILFLHTLFTG